MLSFQNFSRQQPLITAFNAEILFDCNGTQTHKHLLRKRTLNHLAIWLYSSLSLKKWVIAGLNVVVVT